VVAEPHKPYWLYPNLLSLDAPLVAVAWLQIFAKTWRLGYLPWESSAILALGVWVIYVGDRVLDASMLSGMPGRLKPRHQFHRHHQRALGIGMGLAVLATLVLVLTKMPMTIYKHLLPGGVLVAGFFGMSMLSSQEPREVPITKNVLAGVTFAFGTAMMAHIYRWEYAIFEMLMSREFKCFAVLCILNISAIDVWEHASRAADPEIRAADELTLTVFLTLLGAVALIYALLDDQRTSRPFYYAVLTGAALMYILNRTRARFSMDGLRVLADLALLVPVLVFWAASAV